MEKIITGHPEKNSNTDFCLLNKEIITSLENNQNLIGTLKSEAAAKAYIKSMKEGEYRYECTHGS